MRDGITANAQDGEVVLGVVLLMHESENRADPQAVARFFGDRRAGRLIDPYGDLAAAYLNAAVLRVQE